MKRPLVCFTAMFLAALALSLYAGGLSGLMVACAALLFSVCLSDRRKGLQVLLCGLLSTLLALAVAWGQESRLQRWKSLEGETVAFTGWLEEEDPYTRGRGRISGTVLRDGKPARVVIDLRDLGDDLTPGQWLTGQARVLEAREDGETLGGVSLYALAQGEVLEISSPGGFDLFPRLAALRQSLSRMVWAERPGDPAAVVAAMLFSRQDFLSQESLDRFTAAGMRHLLVVSGLHLSLAADGLQRLLRPLGQRGAALLSMMGVWLAAGLAGFSLSALRAAVMVSLALLARLRWEQADSLTSLAFAALVLGIAFPPAMQGLGWQLTFAATLGLILGAKPLAALLENR